MSENEGQHGQMSGQELRRIAYHLARHVPQAHGADVETTNRIAAMRKAVTALCWAAEMLDGDE